MSARAQRRARYLKEIGIEPLWLLRSRAVPAEIAPSAGMPSRDADAEVVIEVGIEVETPPVFEPAPAPSLPASAPAFLPVAAAADATAIEAMDWLQLQAAVAGCERCRLCRGRTQTVFGVGDRQARWLFVGEGPGRNEDLRGEPFVGQAGKLLDNMLAAIGLRREENAYIANVVKCRPTDADGRDRPPSAEEIAACLPYLQRQIALIRPEIIVALGKTAALALLGLDPATPVAQLRGKVHRYAGLPLIVTYHPAYLLRNLADKKKAWADLCLAMASHAHADRS